MSSSNLIEVTYYKESEYGKRPDDLSAVVLQVARMTDESLTGTPTTTESVELRTDRMSAGQVITGLEVDGAINSELSSDTFHDDFMEASMMSSWVAAETINTLVTLTPDPTDDQKATLDLGAEFTNLVPGVLCSFTPAAATIPVIVQITSVDTPSTVFTVATKRGEAAVTAETLDVSIPQHVDIGSKQVSFMIGKAYTDVVSGVTTDERSQTYNGELISTFNMDAQNDAIVTVSYDVMGNGYLPETPSLSQQVETAGGTVTPAGTSQQINSSTDVPLVTINDMASQFCLETFSLTLDNGLSANNCIGKAAPQGFDLGTASVNVTMRVYLSDPSYQQFMPKKLSQEPFSVTVAMINTDGGYAFHAEALQMTAPDPAAAGQNESTYLDIDGNGKVGASGESALRLYKLV